MQKTLICPSQNLPNLQITYSPNLACGVFNPPGKIDTKQTKYTNIITIFVNDIEEKHHTKRN